MAEYVKKALFVYSEKAGEYVKQIQENEFNTEITAITLEAFLDNPKKDLKGNTHVVVSGNLGAIKSVLQLAEKHKFSIGIIPLSFQKNLILCYNLPKKTDEAIELALQNASTTTDLIYCNKEIMLFKAAIGRVPLLDASINSGRFSILFQAIKKLRGLKLLAFNFTTGSKQKIATAASGCMIIQHQEGTLASKLISHDSSLTDGMVSLVITAPFSIIDYLKFLFNICFRSFERKRIASSTGLIKSSEIDIQSENELSVVIDNESITQTPLHCVSVAEAVRINMGEKLSPEGKESGSEKETIKIQNLPSGKELLKAKNGIIPFLSYASEERFKDLFSALKDDSRINGIYIVLMLLSTILATIGLYLDSSAVIIGAMLLAPLMSPIVSFSMGLLRNNKSLFRHSLFKICIGIILALFAAAITSILLPYEPVTPEMRARLNPSLLDLGVAIVAGIAGAYTKSFKEILQSLAGVAIAVALVPPLAVAGVGLGRMDFYFFYQAFLLFSTNLIGIVLAANITFRILGYSAAIRDRRKILFVCIALSIIAIPLYFSYRQIVEKHNFEEAWRHERFLVNGKYLIIHKAELQHSFDKEIIIMDIYARERLTRDDMSQLKKKIQRHFSKKLIIRAKITYIL